MSTSPYHHGDLRRTLVETGIWRLRAAGVDGLTLRGVARLAGVSATAPYRHFADKEALLAAIAAEGFERLRVAVEAADASSRGMEALRAQGVAYVRFAREEPALFRLMFGAAVARGSLSAGAAFGVLRARITSLVPTDRAEIAALSAWSMVHGLASLLIDGRIDPPDPEALVRAVLAQFALGGAQLR